MLWIDWPIRWVQSRGCMRMKLLIAYSSIDHHSNLKRGTKVSQLQLLFEMQNSVPGSHTWTVAEAAAQVLPLHLVGGVSDIVVHPLVQLGHVGDRVGHHFRLVPVEAPGVSWDRLVRKPAAEPLPLEVLERHSVQLDIVFVFLESAMHACLTS